MAQPTIYDIARAAGVGIATVSRVINGGGKVRPATESAVRKAMATLGFRPNRAARRLAAGGCNRPRVAALMPFFSATFYYAVSRPLAQGLAAAGIDFVLHAVQTRDDKQRTLDRILAERACEGLVLCSMGIGEERIAQLARAGIPAVSVDFPVAGLPSATVDNEAGSALATRHLLDCGARHLGLLTGPAAALAFRAREAGFVAVAGRDAPVARADALTREAGRMLAAGLLDGHAGLDGLVCANDILAVGAIEELRARGRRLPEDVQVIGFDDQPMMDVLGLSTIRQPTAALGEWAARAIAGLIRDPSSTPSSQRLDLVLLARSSTRPLVGGAPAPVPKRRKKP
ncbi:MAG: hypothetical protein RLZZ127_2874 [Planctomycetota bacterium]|jgi:LacI family transcriptional regulator